MSTSLKPQTVSMKTPALLATWIALSLSVCATEPPPQLPSTVAETAPTKTSEKFYELSVQLPRLRVGTPIPDYSFVTILRPSPGDDYWYRLPHTLSVKGALPEGVQLVQKGPSFHDLARFSGTPTRAGSYPVTLQATMADGAKSKEVPVVIDVSEGDSPSYTYLFTYGRTRFIAGESLNDSSYASVVTDLGPIPTNSLSEVYSLKVIGLPTGAEFVSPRGDGNFLLSGSINEPGLYPVTLQWGPKEGAPLAEASTTLQVLDKDYVPTKRVVVKSLGRSLRQSDLYEAGGFATPLIHIEDDLGRKTESSYTLIAEGLPKGLMVSSNSPETHPSIVGRALESGTFTFRIKAVFEDGTESESEESTLEVEPAFSLSDMAGTYDCLIDRSDRLNRGNGGRLVATLSRNGSVSGFLVNDFKRFPFTSKDTQLNRETNELTINPPSSGVVIRGTLSEDIQGYSSPSRRMFVLIGTVSLADDAEILAACSGMGAPQVPKGVTSAYSSPHPVNLMAIKGSPFSSEFGETSGPTGIGFSSLRISPTGIVTATVWAADGSAPATCSARLCETQDLGARFNAFFTLRNSSGQSALAGNLFINAEGDAAGQLQWYQNASNRGAFPDGIPLVNYEGVIGSRMVPQPAGLNLDGFEEGLRTAELDFIGTDGAEEDTLQLNIKAQSFQAAANAADEGLIASKTRLRYSPKTGLLTGSLTWKDSTTNEVRPVTFRAMRAPDGSSLMGHFTVPSQAGKSKLEAGEVRIHPADKAQ